MPLPAHSARSALARVRFAAVAAATLWAALACTPALDWREVRLADAGLTALFPCKPLAQTRDAALLDRRIAMHLQSCRAADSNFALSYADVGDPADVAPALARLQAALAANLGATPASRTPYRVAGMTPGGQSVRLRLHGRLPDGAAAEGQAVFFAKGTRIYQAVVLGRPDDAEAADTFFDSLRLPT